MTDQPDTRPQFLALRTSGDPQPSVIVNVDSIVCCTAKADGQTCISMTGDLWVDVDDFVADICAAISAQTVPERNN